MKSNVLIANLCLVLVIIINLAYGAVLFIVPMYAELVDSMGTELNALHRFLFDTCELTGRFSFFLVPLALFSLVSTIAWRIYCSLSLRRLAKKQSKNFPVSQ
jgi:type II secretory pathway component PulF